MPLALPNNQTDRPQIRNNLIQRLICLQHRIENLTHTAITEIITQIAHSGTVPRLRPNEQPVTKQKGKTLEECFDPSVHTHRLTTSCLYLFFEFTFTQVGGPFLNICTEYFTSNSVATLTRVWKPIYLSSNTEQAGNTLVTANRMDDSNGEHNHTHDRPSGTSCFGH